MIQFRSCLSCKESVLLLGGNKLFFSYILIYSKFRISGPHMLCEMDLYQNVMASNLGLCYIPPTISMEIGKTICLVESMIFCGETSSVALLLLRCCTPKKSSRLTFL